MDMNTENGVVILECGSMPLNILLVEMKSHDVGKVIAHYLRLVFFFFFQAEDGIRDYKVTGVQTCALPISGARRAASLPRADARRREDRSPRRAAAARDGAGAHRPESAAAHGAAGPLGGAGPPAGARGRHGAPRRRAARRPTGQRGGTGARPDV